MAFPSGSTLWRGLMSWQASAAAAVLLLILFGWWVMPQRIDRVVSVDGAHEWDAGVAPPQQQVLWEPAQHLGDLLPQGAPPGSLITPRLADGGASLYFTFRADGGQADIYRSRHFQGRWQPAQPVAGLNSDGDDIGPAFTSDGRFVYFYSNRPGGHGGFDLYVAEQDGTGQWGQPRNLGPLVNSPAQEYDPAIAPDGRSLYFASNRTPGMIERPADQSDKDWAATLRAHPGLIQFDLYVARRDSLAADWSSPAPLTALNTAANEGAPAVSPTGSFLYFASDRPQRPGEPPNLDLYRARVVGNSFGEARNLGPSVNTPGHETEPALSPEGFTLVFSSDRQGVHTLYRSRAHEVHDQVSWDTRRWDVVAAVWWKVLLAALALVGLLAILWYSLGWFLEKATVWRFFIASLLLHCFLLWLLHVAQVTHLIIEQIEKVQVAQAPPVQGEQAQQYAQVSDLKAVEAVVPEASRRVSEPLNVPAAVLTAERAVPLQVNPVAPPPPDLTLPARQTVQKLPELRRRPPADPSQLIAEDLPDTATLPATQAPAEQRVAARPVETSRMQATAPTPPRPAPPLTAAAPRQPVKPVELAASSPVKPPDPPNPTLKLPSPNRQPTASIVESDLPADPLPPPATTAGRSSEPPAPAAANVSVDRKPAQSAAPVAAPVAPDQSRPAVVPGAVADQKEPLDAKLPATTSPLLTKPLLASRPRPSGDLADAPMAEPVVQPVQATGKPAEVPLPGVPVNLPRRGDTMPQAPVATPTELSGPRNPANDRLVVGTPGDRPLDMAPSLGPVAAALPRRNPNAGKLAGEEEGLGLADLFSLRFGNKRQQSLEMFGGSKLTEEAVARGLDWLAAHQNPDGSWSLDNFHANCKQHRRCGGAADIEADASASALALLPFFGAGHTHQIDGKHRQTVARGLKWLVQHQTKSGYLAESDYRAMYGHGLAAIVLCEAYGMTKDPALREPAQRAIDFIAKAQHGPSGGWRYSPGQPGDTSVLGWQVMAAKSGQSAGLKVSPQIFEGAQRWLRSVEANKPVGGLFGYQGPSATPAMTAQGLLALMLMGANRDDPRIRAGADYLLRNPAERGAETSYYWYHATQVLFHMQGKHWQTWNAKLRDLLVASQQKEGGLAGSWDPDDRREKTGGRICSTALRLLMLEVYYRHLPLYQQLQVEK